MEASFQQPFSQTCALTLVTRIFWWRCACGKHPFPSRTRRLRPKRPMVLHWRRCGRAGGCQIKWGCSSVGRAPALQAGGQEFDSPHLHQFKQFHAHFAFFLSLAYRCTRRRRRKSELHANLFEFKINIKDCTLKTKQCNKR